jgi:hypothetical protein
LLPICTSNGSCGTASWADLVEGTKAVRWKSKLDQADLIIGLSVLMCLFIAMVVIVVPR